MSENKEIFETIKKSYFRFNYETDSIVKRYFDIINRNIEKNKTFKFSKNKRLPDNYERFRIIPREFFLKNKTTLLSPDDKLNIVYLNHRDYITLLIYSYNYFISYEKNGIEQIYTRIFRDKIRRIFKQWGNNVKNRPKTTREKYELNVVYRKIMDRKNLTEEDYILIENILKCHYINKRLRKRQKIEDNESITKT